MVGSFGTGSNSVAQPTNKVHIDLYCFCVDVACDKLSLLMTNSEKPFSNSLPFPNTLGVGLPFVGLGIRTPSVAVLATVGILGTPVPMTG